MAIQKPFFGGNWKLHHGPTRAREFAGAFAELYPARRDRTVVFFPPALSLAAFREARGTREDLRLGVQDVYWETEGAFTGAISADMARDAGAEFVLAGHSERRHVFGDSDADVARKVAAIADAALTPVLCVGETLDQREAREVEAIVRRQVEAGLEPLAASGVADVVIAYEPVWAIGTGRTASAEDAAEVHALIRDTLGGLIDAPDAGAVPLIYGGSVKPHNISELLAADQVDGVLVGGASLSAEDFAHICQSD